MAAHRRSGGGGRRPPGPPQRLPARGRGRRDARRVRDRWAARVRLRAGEARRVRPRLSSAACAGPGPRRPPARRPPEGAGALERRVPGAGRERRTARRADRCRAVSGGHSGDRHAGLRLESGTSRRERAGGPVAAPAAAAARAAPPRGCGGRGRQREHPAPRAPETRFPRREPGVDPGRRAGRLPRRRVADHRVRQRGPSRGLGAAEAGPAEGSGRGGARLCDLPADRRGHLLASGGGRRRARRPARDVGGDGGAASRDDCRRSCAENAETSPDAVGAPLLLR